MSSEKTSGTPENTVIKSRNKRNTELDNKNRPKYWLQVLGEDLAQSLIKQAHIDAENYHELWKQETGKEYEGARYANRKRFAKAASTTT